MIIIVVILTGCPSQIETWIVTFDSNVGVCSLETMPVNDNSKISAPEEPTKEGYNFSGWYKDSSCNIPWNFATDNVVNNMTLYAKWNINSYTLTFDSNEGTSVQSQSVKYNKYATEPTAPTRTEAIFLGWYADEELTMTWDFETDKIIANITLYAKWDINSYTVSFDSNEGSSVPSQSVEYNSYASEPEEPTKAGYDFIGWYKEPEFTTAWNFASDKIKENTTLYAKWNINSYTVTFNSNEGTMLMLPNNDQRQIEMPV